MAEAKIKGQSKDLYQTVDKYGHTVDFMLALTRDLADTKQFVKEMLKHPKHMPSPISYYR